MKATITVYTESQSFPFVLFGARHYILSANQGNASSVRIVSVEYDDDYKKAIGVPVESKLAVMYYCFLMDCIKYNLRVQRINGEQLKREIVGSSPVEYENIPFNTFNPYIDEYLYTLQKGVNKIEIELRNVGN